MLFIDNKYTRIYFSLITRAVTRTLTGYKEKHHIIPRSTGGSDDKSNLVNLTAKEHYIAHLLLPHMVVDKDHKRSMWGALRCMSKLISPTHQRYVGSARFYEKAKENTDFGVGNRGRIQPLEERQKRANSLKGKVCTDETRQKIGDANRGKGGHSCSEENKLKISARHTGKIVSTETKQKISESSKLRGHNGFKGKGSRGPKPQESIDRYNETIRARKDTVWKMKARPQMTCPHCDKTGDASGMKRFHFDNCKAFSESSKS